MARAHAAWLAGLVILLLALPDSLIAAPSGEPAAPSIDLDPLRRDLPRADLYMQVPGGVLAVDDPAAAAPTIEERAEKRDGGLIIGYCLRSSCTRVTHLAVLQVCANRVGGREGDNQLILGIVRLPYGKTPGYLKSLRGRDYAVNYAAFGPFIQSLIDQSSGPVASVYGLSAAGMGPVAALEFAGLEVRPQQSRETIAFQLTSRRSATFQVNVPRFEVRHLCEQHVS